MFFSGMSHARRRTRLGCVIFNGARVTRGSGGSPSPCPLTPPKAVGIRTSVEVRSGQGAVEWRNCRAVSPACIEPVRPLKAQKARTSRRTVRKECAMKALKASICVAVTALALSLSLGAPSYAGEDEASTLSQQMKELYRAGKYTEALPLAPQPLP